MKRALEALAASLPLAPALNWLTGVASPVFMFQRVLPDGQTCHDPEIVTSTLLFEAFLDWVTQRYSVVPLVELLRLQASSTTKKRNLCALTFDDGWRDTYVHALPLLTRYKLTATVFVPVRFVGTPRRFWQERLWMCFRNIHQDLEVKKVLGRLYRYFPWCPRLSEQDFTLFQLRKLLALRPSSEADNFVECLEEATLTENHPGEASFMTWEQIRELQDAGFTIGSHTLNHTLLTRTAPELARQEIRESRFELEARLNGPIVTFSYPGGRTIPQISADVREAGYQCAVVTRPGFIRTSSGRWALPRIRVSSGVSSVDGRHFSSGRLYFYLTKCAVYDRTACGARSRQRAPERLRIAFVIDGIYDWRLGGTERQLVFLLASLDRRYFEPVLFVLGNSCSVTPGEVPCELHVINPGGEARRLKTLKSLVHALRHFRPHFVQTFLIDGTFYGTLAAWLARVPVIIQTRRNVGYWQKPYHSAVLRLLDCVVDSWQCNSRTIANVLETVEKIPREKIEILPNLLDLTYFVPASLADRANARHQLGLSPDDPVFVTISMLRPVKDVFTIIEAAHRMRPSLPNSKFLIVGTGPQYEALRTRIEELALQDMVKLAGPQFEVRPWLSCADIGLLASRTEGSSNAVLEYRAMGLPSVVSDIPANRELVAGVFFPPGDAATLAQRILWLWEHEAERQFMRDDYREAISQYDRHSFQTRASSYYIRLAAEHLGCR
jgi:glycosyltransferase involved in cell wall biosynthesis/peptidoglycan/xylan/chitin deacetylase (PgdA/CDA1 family)